MKMSRLLILSVLLLVPVCAFSQNKNKIPQLEVSFGGGVGYGGYLVEFDDSPWINHIAQGEGHTSYDFPTTHMRIGAQGGIYVDYNFTKHWGLVSGLEAAYYDTEFQFADNRLLSSFTQTTEAAGKKTEDWYVLGTDCYETHQMISLQIPVMGKYMVSISPKKGHQYYVAAGVKLGFHVFSQAYYESDNASIAKFASRTWSGDIENSTWIKTLSESDPDIPLTCVDVGTGYSSDQFVLNGGTYDEFPVKANPLDVLVSLDTGFRWNLGHGLGLYTGFYCDFGLLRPVAHEQGSKVYKLDLSNARLDKIESGYWSGRIQYERTAMLAADGPDIPYVADEKDSNSPDIIRKVIFPTNGNPLAKSIHHLQAGVKIRFSVGFGKGR